MSISFHKSALRGPQFYKFSDCFLDTVERRLFKKNRRLDVTPKALEVLQVLVENAGEVVSKEDLLEEIWGDSFVEEGNLPVQISKLRSELGANKSEPYIITESGVGYKFVSPVSIVDDDEWSDLIENELAQKQDGKQKFTSIAIMPLLNESGDEEVEYLADGITESLINSLSYSEELRVIARNTVFQFKGSEIDIKKLGRKLRVATILTGRIRVVRENIVIAVELSKVSDGSQIWGIQLNEPFDDIFKIQGKLSKSIVENLKVRMKRGRLSNREHNQINPESYRLYLKGNFFVSKRQVDQVNKAINCYKQAISLDPTNVGAYLGFAFSQYLLYLFDMLSREEALNAMRSNLQIVKRLDPENLDYMMYTGIQKLYLELDAKSAIKLFEYVLDAKPNHYECLACYSRVKAFVGDVAGSLRAIKQMSNVTPFSLDGSIEIGTTLYVLGRYEEAIKQFQEVIDIEPYHYRALMKSSAAFVEIGRFEEALDLLDKAASIQETYEAMSLRGYILASKGLRKEAFQIIEQLKIASRDSAIPETYIGTLYAALNEKSEAIKHLESAFEKKDADIINIQSDPRWKNLKDDNRYKVIISNVGT